MLCDPWIKSLLEHKLMNLEDFRTKQRLFLCLFKDEQPKVHFISNLTIEVVSYSTTKTDQKLKNPKE